MGVRYSALIRSFWISLMALSMRAGRNRPRPAVRLWLPLGLLGAAVVAAVAFVGYVLWPRWPAEVAADTPSLPITVAGTTFNVPPAAIRVPVQRKSGVQERLDLAFLWPSLAPPPVNGKPSKPDPDSPPAKVTDRMFVTLAAADTLPLTERLRTIYPRYTVPTPIAGPAGLMLLGFRDDTPYRNEELAYDPAAPEVFVVRCAKSDSSPVRGSCLYERRIGNADITVRFPRDLLPDWREVASGIDRLIAGFKPSGG
jgi:hypothetical protein